MSHRTPKCRVCGSKNITFKTYARNPCVDKPVDIAHCADCDVPIYGTQAQIVEKFPAHLVAVLEEAERVLREVYGYIAQQAQISPDDVPSFATRINNVASKLKHESEAANV